MYFIVQNMTMYFIVVCCFIFTFTIQSFATLCVLEPMVTLEHPMCNQTLYCPDPDSADTPDSDNRRHKRNIECGTEHLVYLKPGSPSLSHFQSIRDNDQSANNVKDFNLKSLFVTNKTLYYCDESYMYRSFDGTCNNLDNPDWGCTNSEMIRLLPPKYFANGQLRKSKNGTDLPLSRTLSQKLYKDRNKPSKNETLALMQWGQLLAHDTGKSPSFFDKPVDCCASISNECCPIRIPPDDTFFSQYNVTCINMIRTLYINKTINCTTVPYQVAAVSHPIDLSQLYGSTIDVVRSLRQYTGGRLTVHLTENGRVFPELSKNPRVDCNSLNPNTTCFHSSDLRVNQNTQLTCLQTVLLREHNRIASNLSELNPNWDDERLFQESRRILIAMYQHISYDQWLPLTLDKEYIKKFNLTSLKNGYTKYRSDINIATINSFMAGAFRLFHSKIQGNLSMYNATRCPFRTLHISDWMNRPGIIMQGTNFDGLLRGLTVEASQQTDRFFTTQMTEMMFHGDFPYGEDLESFDIERGRDHGLPSYNVMRQLCKFKKAHNFSDLIDDFGEEVVNIIAELYGTVDDIDYFVGGTLEKNHETFMCIIGEQFVRKKFADRFWYEHGDLKHSFTAVQLKEIRKATFSRLICDNGDNITHIQPNGFLSSSLPGNTVVDCSVIPRVNLTMWKDTNGTDTNKTDFDN